MERSSGILVLDIPAPHKGYIDLLKKHSDGSVSKLYLLGDDIRVDLGIRQEIRANNPETTKKLLQGLELPFDVEILRLERVGDLQGQRIYTSRDEFSRRFRERYLPVNTQVTEETAFLRWDETNVKSTRPATVDEETSDPFHIKIMERTRHLADHSSDWWRRVGVAIVKDGVISVEAYNEAFPTDNKPYVDGNPRDFIEAGTLAFMTSTTHAEPAAIAKAARLGISTDGADLYLNSFPCPPCAVAMGLAGIKRCFTIGGNAYLDAVEVMRNIGIKTVFVNEASN